MTKRVNLLSESITIAISTLAKQMKADGIDVLSFSAGEPDFDTPKAIKDAVKNALDSGNCSKYTPVPGEYRVLKAIASKLKRENNLEYRPDQIITNVGAKHSLFNLFGAIIEDGDEVIIPAPYWVSYPEMTKLWGGVPVFVKTCQSNDFKMTPKELKDAITSKTKLLILNSPCNPTGAIYTKDEIRELGEVLKGSDIIVASDEIYEKLSYDVEFTPVASVSKDLFNRTVTINGLSKCGAMPGWRFGYMASNIDSLNLAVRKLQSQSTSNICSLVQAGALPALLGEIDDDIKNMRDEFIRRRDLACELFGRIDGLTLRKPAGAFYIFIDCKKIEKDSMKFCKRLLEEAKVAVVPGVGFGMEGYFRFSYATSRENIKEGIKRIEKFIKNY